MLLSFGLAPPQVQAAEKKEANDKRTVIRFDDDTISGDLMRPDGDLLWSRPRLDMPSLVVPPRSFDEAAQRTLSAAAQEAWRQLVHEGQEGGGTSEGK